MGLDSENMKKYTENVNKSPNVSLTIVSRVECLSRCGTGGSASTLFLKVDLRSAVTRLSSFIKVRVHRVHLTLISFGDSCPFRSTLNFETGRMVESSLGDLDGWFGDLDLGCDLTLSHEATHVRLPPIRRKMLIVLGLAPVPAPFPAFFGKGGHDDVAGFDDARLV